MRDAQLHNWIYTLYCNAVHIITLFCSLQHSPVFKFVNIYYILIHCHEALQHCNCLQFAMQVEVWRSSTLTPFELIFTARPLKLHIDGIAGIAWYGLVVLHPIVLYGILSKRPLKLHFDCISSTSVNATQ